MVELIVFALAAVLVSSLSAAREKALALEQSARREAESANRVKDEFLAAVSHDLRTPLTTVKTLTRLLLRKNPPEAERREFLEGIASECPAVCRSLRSHSSNSWTHSNQRIRAHLRLIYQAI